MTDAQQRVLDEACAAWEVRKLDPMMQQWLGVIDRRHEKVVVSLWKEAFVAGVNFTLQDVEKGIR